jgi:hypothetical protein
MRKLTEELAELFGLALPGQSRGTAKQIKQKMNTPGNWEKQKILPEQ